MSPAIVEQFVKQHFAIHLHMVNNISIVSVQSILAKLSAAFINACPEQSRRDVTGTPSK